MLRRRRSVHCTMYIKLWKFRCHSDPVSRANGLFPPQSQRPMQWEMSACSFTQLHCFSMIWATSVWVNHKLEKFIFLFPYVVESGWPNIVFFHQNIFAYTTLYLVIYFYFLFFLFLPTKLALGGAMMINFTRYVP